ncbi:hypothetical protein J6G99_05945 [bacterium]|nr:hypothetical protein [bacterium]
MAKRDYEMTTVYKYVELLENDLKPEEKKIRNAAENYLSKMRRADKNAQILELLLN